MARRREERRGTGGMHKMKMKQVTVDRSCPGPGRWEIVAWF
jgi:hypothetical protein